MEKTYIYEFSFFITVIMKGNNIEKLESELHLGVIYVSWEESERGWGTRPDGCSLHLTMECFREFEKDYWKRMKAAYGDRVPDEYSRPAGRPVLAGVTGIWFEKIKNSKNGIRLLYNQERAALENGDLIYGPKKSGWVHVL